jgi:ABC-2 type transport system permease protein
VSLTVLGAVLIALTWSIISALPDVTAAADTQRGAGRIISAIVDAADRPLPAALTYPFRIMIRPLAAHQLSDWLKALWPALFLLLLHYVWVLRSDTAFEEAAAEYSARRARQLSNRRAGRAAGLPIPVRATPALLSLAPSGWPAGAILWKNLVGVTRTRRVRNTAMALTAAGALVALLSFEPGGTLADIPGWLAASWGALTILIGPQWVRNDLRGDLLKLDLLRSYPIRGWTIVAAEVSASTVVLTIIQLGILLISYLAFLGNRTMTPSLEERSLLILLAVVCLPAINFLGLLIQNAGALLYPAWVHLGAARIAGIEALGQNLLMMLTSVTLLALMLAIPAAVAGGAYLLLNPSIGMWGAVPATVLALGAMGFEAALMIEWLGRIFERTDSAAAGITA